MKPAHPAVANMTVFQAGVWGTTGGYLLVLWPSLLVLHRKANPLPWENSTVTDLVEQKIRASVTYQGRQLP